MFHSQYVVARIFNCLSMLLKYETTFKGLAAEVSLLVHRMFWLDCSNACWCLLRYATTEKDQAVGISVLVHLMNRLEYSTAGRCFLRRVCNNWQGFTRWLQCDSPKVVLAKIFNCWLMFPDLCNYWQGFSPWNQFASLHDVLAEICNKGTVFSRWNQCYCSQDVLARIFTCWSMSLTDRQQLTRI